MIKTNHVAKNIITKGFINSFPLYDGILTNLEYEIITPTRKHGGIGWTDLKKDIHKYEDITAIKVYVNWYKQVDRDKHIDAEILKKKIYAELLESNRESINIMVDFLE